VECLHRLRRHVGRMLKGESNSWKVLPAASLGDRMG
jgi:hypothetical protein